MKRIVLIAMMCMTATVTVVWPQDSAERKELRNGEYIINASGTNGPPVLKTATMRIAGCNGMLVEGESAYAKTRTTTDIVWWDGCIYSAVYSSNGQRQVCIDISPYPRSPDEAEMNCAWWSRTLTVKCSPSMSETKPTLRIWTDGTNTFLSLQGDPESTSRTYYVIVPGPQKKLILKKTAAQPDWGKWWKE